jgi:hypothetical protein
MKSPPSSVVVGASKPTLSKSASMDVEEQPQQQQATPIMEDEYIEMDPVEATTPSHGRPLQL